MALVFTLLIIVAVIIYYINKSRRIAALKLRYEQSLKGTDKRIALQAGRAYYGALRKGRVLTMYDEQAITNDLSTMGADASSPVL